MVAQLADLDLLRSATESRRTLFKGRLGCDDFSLKQFSGLMLRLGQTPWPIWQLLFFLFGQFWVLVQRLSFSGLQSRQRRTAHHLCQYFLAGPVSSVRTSLDYGARSNSLDCVNDASYCAASFLMARVLACAPSNPAPAGHDADQDHAGFVSSQSLVVVDASILNVGVSCRFLDFRKVLNGIRHVRQFCLLLCGKNRADRRYSYIYSNDFNINESCGDVAWHRLHSFGE